MTQSMQNLNRNIQATEGPRSNSEVENTVIEIQNAVDSLGNRCEAAGGGIGEPKYRSMGMITLEESNKVNRKWSAPERPVGPPVTSNV